MRLFISTYRPAAIGGLILFIVLAVGIFFVLRLLYKKRFPFREITKILALTFAALVLFNAVMALVAVNQYRNEYTADASDAEESEYDGGFAFNDPSHGVVLTVGEIGRASCRERV